ncbi:hypothetical protein RJ640_002188 [Escallonia rubra]|uniref:DNA polymerase III subunit gamma/tau n=1 Tax=Escallonia rubra TaxID=112253 RepID=A0AA88R0S2_9ASTE|nr:hypothetical protein RJ640_002188 [Escallonia rubra]
MVRSALGSHSLLLRPHRSVKLSHRRLRKRFCRVDHGADRAARDGTTLDISDNGGLDFYGVNAMRGYNFPQGDDERNCMATTCVNAPDRPSETGRACPWAHRYEDDDGKEKNRTFACSLADYHITFCPRPSPATGSGDGQCGSSVATGQSDDELSTNYGGLDLEALSRLDGRRWSSSCRSQEGLELVAVNRDGEEERMTKSIRTLSQKYRPMFFEELIGQNIVVQSLMNAILRGRVASLYLFQGPRGTGKTSTARVLAAALNCLASNKTKPCGVCRECSEFILGNVLRQLPPHHGRALLRRRRSRGVRLFPELRPPQPTHPRRRALATRPLHVQLRPRDEDAAIAVIRIKKLHPLNPIVFHHLDHHFRWQLVCCHGTPVHTETIHAIPLQNTQKQKVYGTPIPSR